MGKYRKRPTVIQAVRWERNDGPDALGNDAMALWLGTAYMYIDDHWIYFKGSEGQQLIGRIGDWIACQVLPDGRFDFWPIKPETFAETYEKEELHDR